MFKKIQYVCLLKKYIKCGVWRVAVCPSYIYEARFLNVNILTSEIFFIPLRTSVRGQTVHFDCKVAAHR
jgi:hypothetical protein